MVKIPIVDKDDKFLYFKERTDISLNEIYRVSACWVVNSQGDMLLAQRAFTKKHSPGKRGPAVAGTVSGEETYLENILHEIPEEIGITLVESDLVVGPYYLREGKHTYHCQWYITVLDLPLHAFTKEEGAVEQLKRMSPSELDRMIQEDSTIFSGSIQNRKTLFATYIPGAKI